MGENRFCETCTAVDLERCTIKHVKEINRMANTIPMVSKDLLKEDQDYKNRETALIIGKTIAEVEENGRKHGCSGINKYSGYKHFNNKFSKRYT